MRESKRRIKNIATALICMAMCAAIFLALTACSCDGNKGTTARGTETVETEMNAGNDAEDIHNNNGGSNNNNSNENSTTQPTTTGNNTPTPGTSDHQHNWVAKTKTVHHDEVGHYEEKVIEKAWTEKKQTGTKTVVDKKAYDETVETIVGYRVIYQCTECGELFYGEGKTKEEAGNIAVHLACDHEFYDCPNMEHLHP